MSKLLVNRFVELLFPNNELEGVYGGMNKLSCLVLNNPLLVSIFFCSSSIISSFLSLINKLVIISFKSKSGESFISLSILSLSNPKSLINSSNNSSFSFLFLLFFSLGNIIFNISLLY